MRTVYRVFFVILSVATGALFLYSAYTKLFPIESFEYTITEYVHVPLSLAAIAARFFIGLEAGLGALMIIHLFGKNKWPLKTAFALLIVFSLYLIWLWVKAGNDVNCGCFGDAIWMSPSASLIKNGILLIMIALLIKYHNGFDYPWARIIAPIVLVCMLSLSYILFPVFTRYKIDLSAVYNSNKTFAPTTDLARGKHIIAFVSPSCIHCRRAAYKMHMMKQRNPAIPFYMIIANTTGTIDGFWKDSQAQNIPWTRLELEPFKKYTGGVFPQILWVNNGWVEASSSYPELDQKVIEKWMRGTTNP